MDSFFRSLNQRVSFAIGGFVLGILVSLALGRFMSVLLLIAGLFFLFGWPMVKDRLNFPRKRS
ncbi:MAG: hypothetical protein R2880_00810 [Deinococcales bacterium]